nr:ulp1 protease family, C-terminal catalytic domain-containing protein [Tanacetum cinerariifolium]
HFGSLTENPHNRVALMKKITYMEVEFQIRITSIEDFLKIPRSSNLEKTSNVVAECMSVDKNPSCGSDVNAGNKESMCVDSSVKTPCAIDINANNVHNDSIDFDHDSKVSSKNCEVPLAGAEKIAVDTLMKIINFDIPKEVQREAKASKYCISPYMIQPESTQQNHKVRARNKKVKKRGLPLTAHDAIVPPEISDMLRDNKNKCFLLSMDNEGSFACSEFWERLLSIGKERRRWLSDTMSCCYVVGVTYVVPWFYESVKKVYFSINVEDNHWILAEFPIRSGVITFYDSLPPENLIVEDR